MIAQELKNLGYKTKRGSTTWAETTVIGIIKNEKYKGDVLMGKTIALAPVLKRCLDIFCEEDWYHIPEHHEAIISEEVFEKARETRCGLRDASEPENNMKRRLVEGVAK